MKKEIKVEEIKPSKLAPKGFLKPLNVVARKRENKNMASKESPESVIDLLMKQACCKRPPVPEIEEKLELDKHRHNIRTIILNSNATPFRAYHIDDGFACCFCSDLFKKAADLKTHTIEHHDSKAKSKFKESSSSILTYVVKLDVTGLCCNICNTEMNTLEELLKHFQTHQIVLHTDIKDQIVCFEFDSETLCCVFCSHEFSNFKFLLEHMNEHYRNYVCGDCNAGFINYRMLQAHSEGQDLTVGEVKCPSCNEVFENLSTFRRHEILAHSGFDLNTHKCTHCAQTFKTDERLRDHVQKEHQGWHVYKCGACKKTYPAKNLLVAHTRRAHLHEKKQYKCTVCGWGFYERQHLMNHVVKHSDSGRFQCDTCAKYFKSKKGLIQHLNTHKMGGEFICLSCEETFFRKSYLDDHMRQVHLKEARSKCSVCDKVLYERQLKHHMARRHSELSTFKCEICSVVCKSKYLLIKHMGTHEDIKRPSKKEYECLACGKKFDRKIYVLKHTQRVHLLERPFVCEQCGKKFADTTTLKNHVLTHSETNMFRCFGCDRTFKTKKTMMNHARNHMDERKVKCDLCQHAFIYPYLLKEHKKQVHKIIP